MRRMRYACDWGWVVVSLTLILGLALTSACGLPQPFATQRAAPAPTLTAGLPGNLARFPLPSGVPALNRIAVGSDGSLWLTAFDGSGQMLTYHPIHDSIVRFTPPTLGAATGRFTTFPLPTQDVWPDGITLGPDGALWFTEFYGNAIGRITTFGAVTEYFVPPRLSRDTGNAPESQPHDIVIGPDGNLWFGDSDGNKIGRITPVGAVKEFPLPSRPENPGGFPYDITTGPDGALWFTELSGTRIGRITVDGRITEYGLPGVNHEPGEIVAGGDGALWFTESTQNLLGRITADGHITEYKLPHAPCYDASVVGVCQVESLVAGPDGGIWFTEGWRDALGRIDASGRISEFPVPRLSQTDSGAPQELALGHDCTLWFTYGVGIGRLKPFSAAPGCPSP